MKRTLNAKTSSGVSVLSAALPVRLHLRSDLHLSRKLWHMFMGLLIALVYLSEGMSRSAMVVTLGCGLGVDLLIEFSRLRNPKVNDYVMRFFGLIMRSCEVSRMSGTPYYIAAMILAIGIFPKAVAVLSIIFLACGDPIASLFGILYGDRSIRLASGKSLIGTGAGVLTCILASFIFWNALGITDLSSILILSLVGGIAGGTAELLPLEVDDNFSIPVVSGFVLWLTFIVLGL